MTMIRRQGRSVVGPFRTLGGGQSLELWESVLYTHTYLAWLTSAGVRAGYFGKPSNSATIIELKNEATDGGLQLTPSGSGGVQIGGPVTLPNLAGVASRAVVADANGVLSAP